MRTIADFIEIIKTLNLDYLRIAKYWDTTFLLQAIEMLRKKCLILVAVSKVRRKFNVARHTSSLDEP